MQLKDHISQISQDIKAGRFVNEASVSQGIVLRLLQVLGWQIFDSEIVSPEYSVEGRRVDYALCHPKTKPIIFVEVKQVGMAEGAERQLFEYAFHNGVPMAILTDGQEWHFFLPGEQGKYQERRVYKLDILERDIEESAKRFERYLNYDAVSEGKAIEAARKDYKNVARIRQIKDTLPIAWEKLIDEHDELLIELISDKVESLCGYKPDPDTVANYLSRDFRKENKIAGTITQPTAIHKTSVVTQKKAKSRSGQYKYIFKGKTYEARNARDVLIGVLELLASKDSSFLPRFASRPKHGRKRRFVAPNKMELYPNRPDLCEEHSYELVPGWWAGTNYSKDNIEKILKMASEVAGIKFGTELEIHI